MTVAMDTKFGIIYCAISDIRDFLYFQLQRPQNFKSYIQETRDYPEWTMYNSVAPAVNLRAIFRNPASLGEQHNYHNLHTAQVAPFNF